jgi:predicted metal-dependent phosphoesterase TrpH
LIDLHLHTTASDGSLAPRALVARAAAAGLSVLAVTDHDTVAGLADARAEAGARGLTLVDGIEITAVEAGRDVHMLGYFFDPENASLGAFLHAQRADRVRRVTEIAERLRALGCPIDSAPLLASACGQTGKSIGRPQIADALTAAGYARDRDDAFARLLGNGCPAYVPRCGPSPEEVVGIVETAGGIVSIAHPGLLQNDGLIARLAGAGLSAIEARHSDHDDATEQHYRRMAERLGLAVSGGSDFHGDSGHHPGALGVVTLPRADFERFRSCAR